MSRDDRLIGFEPQEPVEGSLKLAFKYDYLGRRVAKAVYAWDEEDPNDPNDGCWEATPTLHRRFVWYNWLLLEELDVDGNGAVTGVAKKYTWGLDLAGLWGGQTSGLSSLEGAGGTLDPIASRQGQVGGLLATRDVSDPNSPESYVFFYDANGNVGQLIDLSDGSIDAKYEYDPYGGNLLDAADPQESGPYAAENPVRFSTKYFDAETALGYWGYRYYSPGLGRWLNRDPLERATASNPYNFVDNRAADFVDAKGRQATSSQLASTQQATWIIESAGQPTGLDDCATGYIYNLTYTATPPAQVTHLVQVTKCTLTWLDRDSGVVRSKDTWIADASPATPGVRMIQPDRLELALPPKANRSLAEPCYVHQHCESTRGWLDYADGAGRSVHSRHISENGYNTYLQHMKGPKSTTTVDYTIFRLCNCLPPTHTVADLIYRICGFESLVVTGFGQWQVPCIR